MATEILEPLHRLSDQLLLLQAERKMHLLEFDEDDIIAVALVVNAVWGNAWTHNQLKNGKLDVKAAYEVGRRIHDLCLDMTGIDAKKYLQK